MLGESHNGLATSSTLMQSWIKNGTRCKYMVTW